MKNILILISLFMYTTVLAQGDAEWCINTIKKYNEELKKPQGDHIYHFDYTTDFYYWDSQMPAEHINTKLYIAKNQLHYFSNFVDIYVDDTYYVTVFKREKRIVFLLRPDDEDVVNNSMQSMNINNVILDSSEVVKCQETEGGKIELTLNTKVLDFEGFYMEKAVYWCDKANGDIDKISSEFSNQYAIKRMVMTHNKRDLKSKYKGFRPIDKIFLNKNGELIDKYKNYEIIID